MENQTFFQKHKTNPWFWTFLVLAVGLFFAMPLMSLDAGNSGDEDRFQIVQGNYILDYFRSGGKDTNCLTFENLKYYGSSFDVITAFFNETFHIDNIHTSRHIFNSFFGWVTIFFVGLIAVLVGGWRAGVFSLLLLFLSPRFLGHSFNNPKDIPFAASVISALFFMFLFFKQFPKVKWYTVVLLILSIAFSISIRIGGLILFGYFGLFGFLYLLSIIRENRAQHIASQANKKYKKSIKWKELIPMKWVGRLLIFGIGICIVGYFLGILLWPYALQSPIKHPLEAFDAMSKFEIGIKQNFEGIYRSSDLLPWYYTPKFMLITIPIVVMLGAVLYPFLGGLKKGKQLSFLMIYFAFLFPVFWIVYTQANVYGGWRHSIFAYPPMVIAAGLGFDALIKRSNHQIGKIAFTILPFILLFHPIRHIVKNHPYEYIYFNEISGGMDKVYGNYEMDYYYNTTREATEWVIENAEKTGLETTDKIKVASWHYHSVKYFFRNDTAKFTPLFVKWYERGNTDWDYAIFSITGITPEQLKSEHFPPKNTVHTITLNEKPIALVLKRTDKSDFIGNQFLENKELDSALFYLNRAAELDPYNETALINLMSIHHALKNIEQVKYYIDQYNKIETNNSFVNYFEAFYYINKNDIASAEKTCKRIIDYNPRYSAAYVLLAQIYMQQQDMRKMEKVLLQMIDNNAENNDGMGLLLNIYTSQGMSETLAYKKIYKKFLEKYKKAGDKKAYNQMYELYKKLN